MCNLLEDSVTNRVPDTHWSEPIDFLDPCESRQRTTFPHFTAWARSGSPQRGEESELATPQSQGGLKVAPVFLCLYFGLGGYKCTAE